MKTLIIVISSLALIIIWYSIVVFSLVKILQYTGAM
jgi:hypothetical protein